MINVLSTHLNHYDFDSGVIFKQKPGICCANGPRANDEHIRLVNGHMIVGGRKGVGSVKCNVWSQEVRWGGSR